ncbi:MAG: FTR1 family protein [Ilumatobacteraceae bacterium]
MSDRTRTRRFVVWLGALLGVVACTALLPASPAAAGSSRDDAIEQVQNVRVSVDLTLSLIKQGRSDEAFNAAANGYLDHFELVEVPLRIIDNDLTIETEGRFANIRQLIRDHASVDEVRDKLIELRGVLDTIERKLTATGAAAPALIFGQSFLIIFREGFEVVLLVSILLGYLEAARSSSLIKPILIGIGLACVATVLTVVVLRFVFEQLPFSMEVLEGITAMVAVVMLFYVSFWLVARMEHKRWMEFVRARLWSAVSLGSTASLVLVGFTAVYREGFETALFYQALWSFGEGLGQWVLAGLAAGLAALTAVAIVMFRLGRKVPVKRFMSIAVICVMITSITFLGNAVHALQAGDLIDYHRLGSWPQIPIFLSQVTGYWPTLQSVVAQIVLSMIYLAGALYQFVIKPRRAQAKTHDTPAALAAA